MPEPRALGNVAKAVLEAITEELEHNQNDFFEVSVFILSDQHEAAINALRDMAARNNVAVKVIIFLLANQQKQAEEEIMKVKLQRRKGGEPR